MAVAYNSATNTITVTGGTSAAPLTLADVLAADQGAAGSRNLLKWSEDLSNVVWSKRGAVSLTQVTGPLPSYNGWQVTLGAVGLQDVLQAFTAVDNQRYEPSIYLKRVSTSGIVVLRSASGTSYGNWLIDLSLMSSEWERITRTHRAVTVSSDFIGNGSSCTPVIHAQTGTVIIQVAAPQLEKANPQILVVTGTLTPDATGVYVASGTYNGPPAYKRESDGAYWLWWDSVSVAFRITVTLGLPSGSRWSNAQFIGSYAPGAPATGTATVAAVYEKLTLSGTMTPDVAGGYTRAGEYNTQPYYASDAQHDNGSGTQVTWYFWWEIATNRWRLTTGRGVTTGPRWGGPVGTVTFTSTTVAPFDAQSSGTGTVTANAASGQNAISEYQKSGWGVVSSPFANVYLCSANRNIGDGVTSTYLSEAGHTIIAPSTVSVSIKANAQVRYPIRLKIVDQNGAALAGAVVTLTNEAAAQVWQVTTGADGLVAGQAAWTGGNPHRLTVAASGKETLILPAWAIAGAIDWTVEVLDEVFTAQDRTDLQAAKADAAAAKTAALAAKADTAAIKARLPLAGVVPTTEDLAARTLPAADYATAAGQAAIAGGIIGLPAAPSPEAIRQEMEAAGGMLAGAAADAQAALEAAETLEAAGLQTLSAAAADKAEILAAVGGIESGGAIVDAILDALLTDHAAEGTVGYALAQIGQGIGEIRFRYRVLDRAGNPMPDATVRMRTVNDASVKPYRWGITDGYGYVYFNLPMTMGGGKAYMWPSKTGETFSGLPDVEDIPNE